MNIFTKIYRFYYDGFSTMSSTSKQLWLIIFIKLFIMFAVLKVFFFPNFLNSKFDTEEEKAEYISRELTK